MLSRVLILGAQYAGKQSLALCGFLIHEINVFLFPFVSWGLPSFQLVNDWRAAVSKLLSAHHVACVSKNFVFGPKVMRPKNSKRTCQSSPTDLCTIKDFTTLTWKLIRWVILGSLVLVEHLHWQQYNTLYTLFWMKWSPWIAGNSVWNCKYAKIQWPQRGWVKENQCLWLTSHND